MSAGAKPPTEVEITWEKDLVFSGTSGHSSLTLDSAGAAGPSPVQALGYALAACMGMDVVYILKKGRHDLQGLRVRLIGTRADGQPHRFTQVTLHFIVTGPVPLAQVERAIQLSKDTYCSVWHSMRHDIPLETSFEIQR